jgi:hypothetical protein
MGKEGDEIVGADWVGTTEEAARVRITPRSHGHRVAAILSAVRPNPLLPLV